MSLKDLAKSGVLGIGTAAIARDPNVARVFGLAGNMYADQKAQEEEEKKRQGVVQPAQNVGVTATGLKKGGKVKMKSASARADGIAQRGKTRGKMV